MAERTTRAHLEAAVGRLNKLLGTPEAPYSKGADGRYTANVGNLHLDRDIGGWQVCQMLDGGGVTCPLGDARHTAGELWHVLRAAEGGMRLMQEALGKLPRNSVRIDFGSQEDQETFHKVAVKQIGNEAQTMTGLYASLARAAVQRAVRIEKGEAQ